ncbi:cysteine-rich KTR domain-containing protein [Frisingicoccus sp.]
MNTEWIICPICHSKTRLKIAFPFWEQS